MKFFNKIIYNTISFARNKGSLNIVNRLGNIPNYSMIVPNLYLGNINTANDENFLIDNNIQAIINCTQNEPFHKYFENKETLRISINDSREEDNIEQFKSEIINAINFIDDNINKNKPVFIHCYWGLMRSATVVAAYLIKRFNLTHIEAIHMVQEQRPFALSSFYNFNEVLIFVEKTYHSNNSI